MCTHAYTYKSHILTLINQIFNFLFFLHQSFNGGPTPTMHLASLIIGYLIAYLHMT